MLDAPSRKKILPKQFLRSSDAIPATSERWRMRPQPAYTAAIIITYGSPVLGVTRQGRLVNNVPFVRAVLSTGHLGEHGVSTARLRANSNIASAATLSGYLVRSGDGEDLGSIEELMIDP